MTKIKNKNSKIRVRFLALSVFFMLMWVGCDSGLQADEELITINHELYDGAAIQVTLDPDYVHESLSFDTMEEYDNYGITLEEAGKVTVNTRLWNELSHAYDPIEIHKFDMDRSVVVEHIKYTADREAMYSLDLTAENAEPTLEVFYGESGEDDLIEIERVFISLIQSESLSRNDFKNPEAAELYFSLSSNISERQKGIGEEKISSITSANAIFQDHDCNSGSSSCDTAFLLITSPGGSEPHIFRGRFSPTGPVQEAHIAHMLWNQSHRSGARARAKGGTITVIDRLDGLGPRAITYSESEGGAPLWPYHENGTNDLSIPYAYVQVKTSRSTKQSYCNCWTARKGGVKRSSGSGTESYHQARIRSNNANITTDRFQPDPYYVH